jgi:phage virion morphogenesis protein
MNIKVDSAKASLLIKGIADRSANPEEAMRIVSTKMHRDVLRHFGAIEGPEGSQWKPLKESTWKYKLKNGYYNILQNTGNLRRRNVPHNTKTSAVVSNDLVYARTHQYGSGKVPARPFMWLSKDALNDILVYMSKYILRKGVA